MMRQSNILQFLKTSDEDENSGVCETLIARHGVDVPGRDPGLASNYHTLERRQSSTPSLNCSICLPNTIASTQHHAKNK